MFLINLNAEIVACILSFRKSRHKPNLESTSKYGFSPDLGGKNGGVLSMRMQVILDSSFARPGSAPIWGGKKGEFRDWTNRVFARLIYCPSAERGGHESTGEKRGFVVYSTYRTEKVSKYKIFIISLLLI